MYVRFGPVSAARRKEEEERRGDEAHEEVHSRDLRVQHDAAILHGHRKGSALNPGPASSCDATSRD